MGGVTENIKQKKMKQGVGKLDKAPEQQPPRLARESRKYAAPGIAWNDHGAATQLASHSPKLSRDADTPGNGARFCRHHEATIAASNGSNLPVGQVVNDLGIPDRRPFNDSVATMPPPHNRIHQAIPTNTQPRQHSSE